MSTQSIIDKIKGLQKLSQSTNVNEAAAAAKMADLLISKYRIDEATLDMEGNSSSEPVADSNILYKAARIVNWKSNLAVRLAGHYGCAIFNNGLFNASKGGRKVSRYRLVGKQSDIELTTFMYGWLVAEIERLCRFNCKGQGHITSQSYCEGVVNGVTIQLKDSKEQAKKNAEASGQTTALAVLDNRQIEAVDKMNQLFKLNKAKKLYSKSYVNLDAYEQGIEDGKSMHLAKGLNEANVKQIS